MDSFASVIHQLHRIVWGPWTLVLFLGVGIYFTVKLKFFQVVKFPYWFGQTLGAFFKKAEKKNGMEKSGISQFQSLCTSLAATIGTGNIAGVATAIVAGGPGAVFWMWVSATLGMMTIYAENYLGIKYRYRKNNEWMGGPMVYLERGLGMKKGAACFALLCILVSFGMGNMAQSNSVSTALWDTWKVSPLITGIILLAVTGFVILGGLKRIASVAEKIIPFSSGIYILFSLMVIGKHISNVLPVFQRIFRDAFSFTAISGGIAGYGVFAAIKYGVARGVFSNEAGLGSSVLIHASAEDTTAKQQGMWGILEVWIDTMVLCTLTALVILCSGAYDANPSLNGSSLSIAAYDTIFGGFGQIFVMIAMAVFAFATLIGWSYIGEQCTKYLFGNNRVKMYKTIFLSMIFIGSLTKLELVWELSDVFNGLMAVPNLIALILLAKEVKI